MKATGIVRRIDDLGRVVIPKEIRRTMRIREGDPLHITLTVFDKFCWAIHSVVERYKIQRSEFHSAVYDYFILSLELHHGQTTFVSFSKKESDSLQLGQIIST